MKQTKRTKRKQAKIDWKYLITYTVIGLIALGVLIGAFIFKLNPELMTEVEHSLLRYSDEEVPAVIEDDKGNIEELEEVPTVEEVDGGLFKDKDTGLSLSEGEYQDLGWSETYNVSSPEAFKNDTLNKCIIANNYYGAQCVSLARVFWWSYADRDVSTCGTGMAKGMMKCSEQNAGDDFLVYWKNDVDKIQAGDWLVFDGGRYGHVGMALGKVVNGYVALLGENQGGHSCGIDTGGSATNIINLNIKNLIGFYRPKAYIKPVTPEPTPEPETSSKCKTYTVKKGDTMSKIMKDCLGEIDWSKMNDYANHWTSTKINPGKTVFYGWTHVNGYGLFYGDVIKYQE